MMSGGLRKLVILAMAAGLTACASYPVSSVSQGTAQGRIAFPGAAPGLRVMVDGVDAGDAAAYDGRAGVLGVAPGRRVVRLMDGATVVMERTLVIAPGALVEAPAP